MLRSVKQLNGYFLQAKDGKIGQSRDFLFDDEIWVIRYLVADTGKWLPGKKVLISPISLAEPDWVSNRFPVRLTKKQVEEAPLLGEHLPVSRQYEVKYHEYYGWPGYWDGGEVWGGYSYPMPLYSEKRKEIVKADPEGKESHLRSTEEVAGYHIQARDGEIGHVEDFIVDDELWSIRYMVIDTHNWLPGSRKVLISIAWVESIDWLENKMKVDLSVKQIKESPDYDPTTPVNREYEMRLYDFYGRPKYW